MKRLAIFGCVALLAVFAAAGASYAPHIGGMQDVSRYASIASNIRDAAAGTDLQIRSEYPPFTSALFYAVDAVPGVSFAYAWIGFLVLALGLTAAYTYAFLERRDAVFLLTACVALPLLLSKELTFARYDILVMFPLFLAWKAHQRERYADSAAFLVLAASIKLVPVLALPLLLLAAPPRKRMQVVGGALIGLGISVLVPMLLIGFHAFWSNVVYMLSYHGARGIQVESTWSGIQLLLSNLHGQHVTLDNSSMSMNNPALGHGFVLLSGMLTLLSAAGVAALTFSDKVRSSGSAPLFLAVFLLMLAFAPVLSPQDFVWIVPLLLVHAFDLWWRSHKISGAVMLGLAAGIALLTQWIFPWHYGEFLDQKTLLPLVILVARNALIALAALFLLYEPIMVLVRQVTGRSSRRQRWLVLEKISRLTPGRTGAVFLAALALLGAAYWSFVPHFGVVRYTYDGQPAAMERMPFFTDTESEYFNVEVNMMLGRVHPVLFNIRPDDCIEEFTINGKVPPSSSARFCEYGGGRTVNLAGYVQSGDNMLTMRIKDTGGVGGINIGMSRFDPLFILCALLLVILLVLYACTLRKLHWIRSHTGLVAVFIGGAALRIIYVAATPMASRAHDMDGHVEYIRYVLTHWAIPAAQTGWEFHQPPLYYFLAAVWAKVWVLLGASTYHAITLLQVPSLMLSVASLAISLWVSLMLFPKTNTTARTLFLSVIATFPALLFVAARVSNDSLSQLLSIAFFAGLLAWWKTGSLRRWYVLGLIVAIACLTKASAAAMLATTGLCFLVHPRLTFSRKLLHGAGWLALIAVLSGWLPVMRVFFEADNSRYLLLGNQGMNGALEVPASLRLFAIFDPWEVIKVTFNNTWSDEYRRQFFWEFFFKSAFFGEYQFDALRRVCQMALTFGMLCIPLGCMGMVRALPKPKADSPALPTLVTLVIGLAAAVAYAWKFRYAPNQDFRFSAMLVLPLAYYVVQGSEALPWEWARIAARVVIGGLCTSSAIFILLLFIRG